MTRLIFVLAATTALAACGSKETPPPEPVETDIAVATPAAGAATGNMAGTYEVKMADGSLIRETINADGTYTDTNAAGTVTEKGKWRQDGAKMCFDADGAAPEQCFTGGAPGADGTFEIKDETGKVVSTSRKVDAGAVPAAQ